MSERPTLTADELADLKHRALWHPSLPSSEWAPIVDTAEAALARAVRAEAERDRLREALKTACWELACYTFRGKDVSLGEERDAHVARLEALDPEGGDAHGRDSSSRHAVSGRSAGNEPAPNADTERAGRPPHYHEVKCWPAFYDAIVSGAKTFEVRPDDRDYRTGDLICLREYVHTARSYTGHSHSARITYVLPGGQFGVQEGFVVLGLASTDEPSERVPSAVLDQVEEALARPFFGGEREQADALAALREARGDR